MNTEALPFDLRKIDIEAFLADVKALRREVDDSLCEEDLLHLYKIERWGRTCTALGLLGAGIAPNPASAILLAIGRSTRWIIMHHVGHRGYDKVPGVPPERTSKVFARGHRRWLDWFDWMTPEAWIYEHNVLHHSYTGELRDPDLIERNSEYVQGYPKAIRYALLGLLSVTWRFSYYAPSTLDVYRDRHAGRENKEKQRNRNAELILDCYLPYAALHFGLMPLLYMPLGPWGVFSAFTNSVMAEALSNLHTYLVVGPNHAGDDIYRFDDRPASRAEHNVRQVIGSVNYATGGDPNDFAHLFLNYQIEHHIWPDLPMRQYQVVQPKVKALCEKYGIPYVQESVFKRFKKMIDIAAGNTVMPRGVRRNERANSSTEAPPVEAMG